MTGIERIAHERARQMLEEGWTPEHDDQHSDGEMAAAAACYAGDGAMKLERMSALPGGVPLTWPWSAEWWKPTNDGTIEGRIRQLEKAGALIAAEIDRLQRAGASLSTDQRAATPPDRIS